MTFNPQLSLIKSLLLKVVIVQAVYLQAPVLAQQSGNADPVIELENVDKPQLAHDIPDASEKDVIVSNPARKPIDPLLLDSLNASLARNSTQP